MNIKIYQVNMDRDEDRVAFMSLDSLARFQMTANVNSTIYDKVFEGEVDCNGLEDVYRMFNLEHPDGYRGRSLSVSDIVEVSEGNDLEPGYYFCDSIGFQKVDFEPDLTTDRDAGEKIKVVLLQPGKLAEVAEIDSSLEGLQAVVGGDIEAVYPFAEEVCIVCNEEGKINGLPLNRAIRAEDSFTEMSYAELTAAFREMERRGNGEHMMGYIVFTEDSFDRPYPEEARTYFVSSDCKAFQPNMGGYSIYGSSLDGSDLCVRLDGYMAAEKGGKDGWKIERCYTKERGGEIVDIIAGTCFVCDCSGENFGSLSDDQIKRYTQKYLQPEHFFRLGNEIQALPYTPKDKGQER